MDWMEAALGIDVGSECRQIERFIEEQRFQMGRDGLVLGLSGGLDSAVIAYLSVRSVGSDKVTLIYMPERDSKARHREDAELIAQELGIELQVIDMTSVLETAGVYDLLPLNTLPSRSLKQWAVKLGKKVGAGSYGEDVLAERLNPAPGSLIARGNAYASSKQRLRMILLYYHADIHRLLVVGAGNKTEFLTGTFSKWGCDQCADIMPIIHLYRSQLPALAEHLGIPERIRTKPADPDVMPGVDDKEEMLGGFLKVDQILWALDQDVPFDLLVKRFGEGEVRRVLALKRSSRHMRESPYTLYRQD